MDDAIEKANRARGHGDPLGALRYVALREDALALALRGVAMAQLGEATASKPEPYYGVQRGDGSIYCPSLSESELPNPDANPRVQHWARSFTLSRERAGRGSERNLGRATRATAHSRSANGSLRRLCRLGHPRVLRRA